MHNFSTAVDVSFSSSDLEVCLLCSCTQMTPSLNSLYCFIELVSDNPCECAMIAHVASITFEIILLP